MRRLIKLLLLFFWLCYESLLPSTRSQLVIGFCQYTSPSQEPKSGLWAPVQVQNLFYDNCWEIRYMLSTQGASRAGLFFQPTVGAWNRFWTVDLCRIFFLPMCTFQNHPAPHPTTPSPPQKWSARQTVENMRTFSLIFPLSRNICFAFQSLAIFSGQVHVLCIRNFVTWAWLIQTGKWPLLKIRGLWEMRFSDISGHRSIRICIVRQSLFTIGDNVQRLRVN